MEEKEQALLRIAKALRDEGIRWALGASMLLYYHGLVEQANDIDLLIDPGDMDAADARLSAMGTKRPPYDNERFSTDRFCQYTIDGVSVDVMAGLGVRYAGEDYAYALEADSIHTIVVKGEAIPLSSLEDWLILYLLMENREEKARRIEEHLLKQGMDRALVCRRLAQPLPLNAKERLRRMIEDA